MALMVIEPTPTGCTYTTSVGVRIAYGTSRKRAPVAQRGLDDLTAKVRLGNPAEYILSTAATS